MSAIDYFLASLPINLAMLFLGVACIITLIWLLKLKQKRYDDFLRLIIVLHGIWYTFSALIIRNFIFEGKPSEFVTYGAIAWMTNMVVVILFATYLRRKEEEKVDERIDSVFEGLDLIGDKFIEKLKSVRKRWRT